MQLRCGLCSVQFVRGIFRPRVVYKAHHKCIAEQQLPVEEQSGAVQYQRCECCFRSRGGLAIHKCETSEHSTQDSFPPEQSFLCNDCGRRFRRPGDLKRHKCLP